MEEIIRVEEAVPPDARVMLVGLRVVVNPVGELDLVSDTVPVKPSRLERLMVDVAELPWPIVMDVGLVDMMKSGVAEVTMLQESVKLPVVGMNCAWIEVLLTVYFV